MSQVSNTTETKVIAFQINDKEYVIPVSQVRSIEKMMPITRVPRTPHFVEGVINLRGVVTPIIDLRKRLGVDEAPYNDHTRIIIVHLEDKEVGLIVDSANDVLDLPAESIEPQPEVVGAQDEEYITGVAKLNKRLLVLMNLEKVLHSST
jgi:purine-binding chemotaxis protein CheW